MVRLGPIISGLALSALTFAIGADAMPRRARRAIGAVENAMIPADAEEWPSHGRTYDEQRFSPLASIDTANVGQLRLAWHADLGQARGAEATPIVVDGVMYVTSAWSIVHAYDAATGRPLWRYDPQVPRETLVSACCDAVNRGVAVWRGRVFVGALDGRLIALDARSGRPLWSVQTTDKTRPYTITGAPRVVRDMVIIGNGGSELGVRGFVSAYAAATGKRVWRFYTVPGRPGKADHEISDAPLAKAAATWHGDAWWKAKAGGGTAWDAFAYDPKLDLLYIGTGNGSPWNRAARSEGRGDNLFLSSILAVRALTGQLVWHYQLTPGDEWDYTATQSIVLADLPIGGTVRHVLMQAPKNGFFYVLDRQTGALLSADKFVPANWAERIDLQTGRPIENPDARYSENRRPFFQTPSSLGGHNWPPMSFNPKTGLVYIPAQETMLNFSARSNYRPHAMGYNTGTDFDAPQPADKAPLRKTAGYLLAWDPIARREVWRAPRDTFGNGGVLTTAGNLVFQGTGTGMFKALDAASGRELWSFSAQAGVIAPAVTYRIKSRQYVAVLVGCGGVYGSACRMVGPDGRKPNIDRVLVFSLDGRDSLPPMPAPEPQIPVTPEIAQDSILIERGRRLYGDYCSVCHGYSGVSLGNQPDLRFSPVLTDADSWRAIVIDGALRDRGMASFAPAFSREDDEAIRHYVASLALTVRATSSPEATMLPGHSN